LLCEDRPRAWSSWGGKGGRRRSTEVGCQPRGRPRASLPDGGHDRRDAPHLWPSGGVVPGAGRDDGGWPARRPAGGQRWWSSTASIVPPQSGRGRRRPRAPLDIIVAMLQAGGPRFRRRRGDREWARRRSVGTFSVIYVSGGDGCLHSGFCIRKRAGSWTSATGLPHVPAVERFRLQGHLFVAAGFALAMVCRRCSPATPIAPEPCAALSRRQRWPSSFLRTGPIVLFDWFLDYAGAERAGGRQSSATSISRKGDEPGRPPGHRASPMRRESRTACDSDDLAVAPRQVTEANGCRVQEDVVEYPPCCSVAAPGAPACGLWSRSA